MDLNRLLLDQALQALGDILLQRRLSFEIVAVGGSGLLLLGFIDRPTRDLDVVALVEEGRYVPARPLPAVLAEAVTDVADILGLPPDWVNAGPTDLLSSACLRASTSASIRTVRRARPPPRRPLRPDLLKAVRGSGSGAQKQAHGRLATPRSHGRRAAPRRAVDSYARPFGGVPTGARESLRHIRGERCRRAHLVVSRK